MDDELLRALARHHRRTHGETDPGMPPTSDGSADERAAELSRPLSAQERDSVLDAVFSAVDASADAGSAPVARSSAKRGVIAVIGVAVAIAAALVLWIARPGGNAAVELPAYSITSLKGGVATVRAEPTEVDRELLLEGDANEIDVVVTPASAVQGPLAVTLVAQAPDEAPRMTIAESAEISESGAIRLRGRVTRFLRLPPGAWQLWVVVTPANRVPKDPDDALHNESYARASFRVKLTSAR
ncbi:MAG TPA: hypothetical protein VFG69_09020 [Nannocystaceae bacterium]|nr:hypothetical protein [Nannocystaceae bacterium]